MSNIRKRHTPEQVVRKLGQADRAADGSDIAAVCRELGISEQTYYRWRNQYGGLKADDAKRLRELEKQNATLKRLLAEAELEKAALKELAEGASRPGKVPRRRLAPDQDTAGERADGVPSGRAEQVRVPSPAQGRHGRRP